MDNSLVKLLQDLIQIPSWVSPDGGKTQNENNLVDYLETWLKSNTNMIVERQELENGRFNLIAKKGNPDLVFLAHTDTVNPSAEFRYGAFSGEIHDDQIWGLGASDMKSGVATMISALSLVPDVNNVWMFLYADEEYDFLGMKALRENYAHLRPKLIVSSDASDLRFGHGCRGLLEFRGRFLGETGHPALGTGRSAIARGWNCLNDLETFVKGFVHPVMGDSSFNVAYVLGGARNQDSINESGRLIAVGQAGNIVPDVMEFVLDIRPSSPELTLDSVLEELDRLAKESGLLFEIVERTHELGAWYTDPSLLNPYIQIADTIIGKSAEISNPARSGYIDLEMFWSQTEKPPAFMFGGGVGSTAHTPEERILVESLVKTRDFFLEVLRKHSQGLLLTN